MDINEKDNMKKIKGKMQFNTIVPIIFLIFITIILSTSVAYADWFYKMVGYECDTKSNIITISFQGAYNEDGEEMIKQKSSRQWTPDELVGSMKDADHIGSLKTIKRKCKLKDGTYTIKIGPAPGNTNVQGRCGAWITAWAEVRHGSKVVLPRRYFEAWCDDSQTPVITSIIIKAGKKKPIIKTVSQDEFYK